MSDPVLYCPYCNKQAEWLPDSSVYSKSYGGYVYACITCDAHIGCHKCGDNKQSKGTLANKELRRLRILCLIRFGSRRGNCVGGGRRKRETRRIFGWHRS
jgi:zinc-finger-containing domain